MSSACLLSYTDKRWVSHFFVWTTGIQYYQTIQLAFSNLKTSFSTLRLNKLCPAFLSIESWVEWFLFALVIDFNSFCWWYQWHCQDLQQLLVFWSTVNRKRNNTRLPDWHFSKPRMFYLNWIERKWQNYCPILKPTAKSRKYCEYSENVPAIVGWDNAQRIVT